MGVQGEYIYTFCIGCTLFANIYECIWITIYIFGLEHFIYFKISLYSIYILSSEIKICQLKLSNQKSSSITTHRTEFYVVRKPNLHIHKGFFLSRLLPK